MQNGYKGKQGNFMTGGVQTQPVKPTLPLNENDDIMDQNLGKALPNIVGAQ